jgi:phosphopantothenoylcysteine synthetase/decarboxylase
MKIILGITGSISAYKAVDIMRTFQKQGHEVSVVLTEAAGHFTGPLTFETFCPGKVYTGMFDPSKDPLLHINICKDHDLLLIAPATANIIGKMANGIADDLLSTIYLAYYKTVAVSPAMNSYMLEHPAVKENLALLEKRGVHIIEPDEGSLACKDEGRGKLPTPERIVESCLKLPLKTGS